MFSFFPTRLGSVLSGHFHSVIPQLFLVHISTVSDDLIEIQEESTVRDTDRRVFYIPFNRDWVQGLRVDWNENGKLCSS